MILVQTSVFSVSPSWLIWAAFGIFLLFLGFSYWAYSRTAPGFSGQKKGVLVFLRASALTLTAVLLLHPVVSRHFPEKQYPGVTVWFDASGSMDKWLSPGKRDSLTGEIRELAGDSLSIRIRYFSRTLSDVPFTDASWRSETRLTQVVEETDPGYTLVVTDGVFSDFDWLSALPRGRWDAVILGDTVRPAGFLLLPLLSPEITGYEGEDVRIPAGVTWSGVSGDSALLSLSLNGQVSVRPIQPVSSGGSVTAAFQSELPQPGTYPYTISLKSRDGIQTLQGKVVVKPRIRRAVIFSSAPEPLAGFFKRQLEASGKISVLDVIDDPLKPASGKTPQFDSKGQVLHIWVNYPVKSGSRFTGLLKPEDPLLMVSTQKPEIPLLPDGIKKWENLPDALQGQSWLPLPGSGAASRIWQGWTETRFRNLPPQTVPLKAWPVTDRQSVLSVMEMNGQEVNIPTEVLISLEPKRVWLAAGNWEQWEKWQAIGGQNPTETAVAFRQTLTWLLTPGQDQPVTTRILPDPATGELIFSALLQSPVLLSQKDSLRAELNWGGQSARILSGNQDGLFELRLPVPDSAVTTWNLKLTGTGSVAATSSGRYLKSSNSLEKEITRSETEPLGSWIKPAGGKLFYGFPAPDTLKKRIAETGKTVNSVSTWDGWSSLVWLLTILSLLSAEWIIRKRSGAL